MKANNNKIQIRRQIQDKLRALTTSDRQLFSKQICQNLAEWRIFQDCRAIISFVPMMVEPAILPLLRDCLADKAVALVRTPADNGGLLETYYWTGQDNDLEAHPTMPLLQIRADLSRLEPDAWSASERTRVLVLVPGLGFSLLGSRLGRGKGWYDRFLAAWPEMIRVGVCFENQLHDDLPQEPWDQKIDYLVSEKRLVTCPPRKL